MKRTLLAVGFAVLVSMLLAPHDERSSIGLQGAVFFLFWRLFSFPAGVGFYWTRPYYGYEKKVMIDMLALQTVFLAVLFAVCVNLRRSRRRVEKAKS